MKNNLLLLFTLALLNSGAQTLYDPQILYDAPGGVMDPSILRSMEITFYDSQYNNILDASWQSNLGIRLPATVQLDGGELYPNVMVRYKGNSTYAIPRDQGNPKVPYNLDFNDSVEGQQLMGYNKIKLANAIFDPTFAKEITAYNIYKRYLPTPEANLMQLTVQGDYLGLYVNTESVDRKFLKKHFGENKGVLFKCDPIQQFGQNNGPIGNSDLTWYGTDSTQYYNHYDCKTDHGWKELVNFINVLNNSPSHLDTVLNIDRVLWAFAVNQAILNLDTYNGLYQHNYYLYQTGDGLFQMIPWDASESFLGALLGANMNSMALFQYDPYNGYNSWWYPLSIELTSNPYSKYGKIYSAHLRTVINESLNSSTIENFVDDIQVIGAAAASSDPNMFFGMTEYYNNVNSDLVIPFVFSCGGITSSVDIRKPYLESLAPISALPPTIGNPIVLNQGSSGENFVTAQVSNATSVELMATTSVYNSKFKSVSMYDDGTNGDLIANDGNYTGAFPWYMGGKTAKFYIRATNTNATMLNPERAEYEFWMYDLPLSSEPLENTLTISIYPNPTSDFIFISKSNETKLNYTVLDAAGIQMAKEELVSNYFDVSNYANGVYFVQFADENGRSTTKKFVVCKSL